MNSVSRLFWIWLEKFLIDISNLLGEFNPRFFSHGIKTENNFTSKQ